jgi:hypothetical protein
MAGEKIHMTATTDSYIKEVGLDSIDEANRQGGERDFAPIRAPNNGILEVGLLK